ncbi:MAG: cytochrome c oxidase subunit 4 [Acidimicrobiales bacterium]
MKVGARMLVVIGFFFGIIGIIYWFTSYEDAGFLMLIGATFLGLLPGSYYYWWSRRMKPRPSDDPDASIEASAGTVDTFPSSSIWPFILGSGAFFIGLSLVFGIWLVPIAAALVLTASVGATLESRRGGTV